MACALAPAPEKEQHRYVETPSTNDDKLGLQLKYSWGWFSYHAGQRLSEFHFFLLIIGGVIIAYFTCLREKVPWLGFGTALFGLVVSIAFIFLDIRNTQLVNDARESLVPIEEKLGVAIRSRDVQRRKKSWWITRKLLSHGTWLKLIEGLTAVGFAVAALDVLYRFLGVWK